MSQLDRVELLSEPGWLDQVDGPSSQTWISEHSLDSTTDMMDTNTGLGKHANMNRIGHKCEQMGPTGPSTPVTGKHLRQHNKGSHRSHLREGRMGSVIEVMIDEVQLSVGRKTITKRRDHHRVRWGCRRWYRLRQLVGLGSIVGHRVKNLFGMMVDIVRPTTGLKTARKRRREW